MASYYEKSLNEVVQNIINNIHTTLPDVDTKEGTFIRDVFIDPISDEFAAMYGDMQLLRLAQSPLTAVGDDLDFLASNFFITRKAATKSSGKIRFYIKNTNKPLSSLKDGDLPDELSIPIGTILSTIATYSSSAYTFQTTESAYYTLEGLKALTIDAETGYRYIEIPAQSTSAGSVYNVGAGEICTQTSNNNDAIAFVSNPFAFTGGSDYENDTDLTLRIQLAISGSNIGTKDGYLAYIMKQDGVTDSKIIGAGDSIMFRDGGYIRADGKYQPGKGGMVDIYIRGLINQESTWELKITNDYIFGDNAFANIVFPNQPLNSIVSITSTLTGKTFINADDYENEKFTIKDTLDPTKTTIDVKYCMDIMWDFSITDSFPDSEYYPLPNGMTQEQITALKKSVDAELTSAFAYMSNLSYGLDWANVETKTSEGGSTALFNKLFHNNLVYKIIAKDGTNLNGRQFVMKNDRIYVRVYRQPDYLLSKDITTESGSIKSSDSIKWLTTNKLAVDDTLIITYNYDYLIKKLQNGIDKVRCLTADVLVKQAEKIPIEIIADVSCYTTADINTLKKNLSNDLVYWLDSLQPLGGTFDKSDIVAIIKQRDAVDSVDLSTIQIAIKGYSPQTKISCADNQYFKAENIILNVYYNNQIIM